MKGTTLGLLVGAAGLAATGQVLLKLGAHGNQGFADFVNPKVGAGLVLYGLGTALWLAALAREPLVQVYAFTALSFVLVYAAGVLLLGERLAPAGLAGVALVLAGLALITRSGG